MVRPTLPVIVLISCVVANCSWAITGLHSSRANLSGSGAAEELFGSYYGREYGCGENKYKNSIGSSNNIKRPAKPGEFPHQVRIEISNNGQGRRYCGGALIDEGHVLTAAHCVVEKCSKGNCTAVEPADIKVILGDHSSANTRWQINIKVRTVMVHESFNATTRFNDLAVLRLAERVNYKLTKIGHGSINRVCLPLAGISPRVNARVFSTGWGGSESTGVTLSELEVDEQRVQRSADCKPESNLDIDLKDQFCAAGDTLTKLTCGGDSGGPLVLLNGNSKFELVGIMASEWEGCSNRAAYTDVSHYINWILSRI